MNLPHDPTLPFFSYGLFRPGQIGYGDIRTYVETSEEGWATHGELLERDGLPLLAEGTDEVLGWLIRFKPEGSNNDELTPNCHLHLVISMCRRT